MLATALLRLAEQGRIDPVLPVEGAPYTPIHLLRHQSGLPDYGALPNYHADVAAGRPPWPIDDLLQAAEADRLRFLPGQGWAYSNIGYWKVARLIETAADRPLADALADLVFDPAELTARLATDPADLAGVEMGDAPDYHPGWVYHGLVVGPALEAARLLRRLLAGDLLAPATLAAMRDATPLPQFRSALHPDPAYGLGLMRPAPDRFGHTGAGPGSRIAVYASPGLTCAVWAPTSTPLDPEAEVFDTLQHPSPSPS